MRTPDVAEPPTSTWVKPGILLEAVGLSVAMALFLNLGREDIIPKIFHDRDLSRGLALASGKEIFFGPEMSGGGHLPGSLFYLLIAVPLSLGAGWKGVWLQGVILNALAMAALWVFARHYFSLRAAIVMATGFAFSSNLHNSMQRFMNSSFIYLFVAASLIGLTLTFSVVGTRSRLRWWLLFCLAVGFGSQIHLSLLGLVAIALVLHSWAPALKLRRLTGHEIGWGAVVLGLSWVPFALWSLAGHFDFTWGQPAPDLTLGPAKGTSFILHHMRLRTIGGQMSTPDIVSSLLRNLIPGQALVVGGAMLIFKGGSGPARFARDSSVVLLAVTVGYMLSLHRFLIGDAFFRYLSCGSVALIVLLATAMEAWRPRGPIPAVAVAVGLFGIWMSETHRDDFRPTSKDFAWVSERIVARTNWNFDEAKQRLYFVNTQNELSIGAYYAEALERRRGPPQMSSPPDGFFVVTINGERIPRRPEPLATWLVQHRVEASLQETILRGDLQILEPEFFADRMALIPYRVRDRLGDWQLHNHNDTYDTDQERQIDARLAMAKQFPKQWAAAVFNHCPTQSGYCRVAIVAHSEDLSDPGRPIRIQLLGVPLAFDTRWVSPHWTEVLENVYFSARCRDKTSTIRVAGSVGLQVPTTLGIRNRDMSLLTPFQRAFKVDCRNRIENLDLGFQSAMGYSMAGLHMLGGDYKSLAIPK